MLEWIKPKGVSEEILLWWEKENAGCFASWQFKQLNDSNLVDSNNPRQIKGWILLAEAWPRRRCYWWMEELGIVVADTYIWGRYKDAS